MTDGARQPLILPSDRIVVPEGADGEPRRDYRELARALGDAPLLFPPSGGRDLTMALEDRTASDLRQAILAVRRHRSVSVYVSLSERIGLPLALLLAARRIRTTHVLVAHHLTSERKRSLQKRIGWLRRFTRIVVLSEPQAEYLRREVHYPDERILLLPYAVDTDFWKPSRKEYIASPSFVLSVGRERRDYGTLAAAQEKAGFPLTVVASSQWARQGKGTVLSGLSFLELRSLYARAAVVVLPLEAQTAYAAGATGLLEAMAMGKPVVLTETPGLAGYGEGIVCRVSPSDPDALAEAIRSFLAEPRLQPEAHRAVEERHSLDQYVARLSGIVRETEAER